MTIAHLFRFQGKTLSTNRASFATLCTAFPVWPCNGKASTSKGTELNIVKDTVVTITYIVRDMDGKLLEESEEPVSYLHGGYDNIFPMVEAALEGKAVGEKVELKLQPVDAFGEMDEDLVRLEARDSFPADIEVGMQFVGSPVDGSEEMLYTVTDIAEDKVVVDGNHPYAGQAVHFECQVAEVRAATADEVSHRHAHGAHGHHHH